MKRLSTSQATTIKINQTASIGIPTPYDALSAAEVTLCNKPPLTPAVRRGKLVGEEKANMLPTPLGWRQELTPETVSTGITQADALIAGCPRGRITEIVGPVSSGRTSLLHSILAETTQRGEFCAAVDACDSFDPQSAAAAGVDLGKLVWIRCGGNAGHAMRAADLVIQSGGFGVVALDLADVPARISSRIPLSYWYRFRRAIEDTPTILVLVEEQQPLARSCASLLMDVQREKTTFIGRFPFQLLRSVEYHLTPRKPMRPAGAKFEVKAIAG